MGGWGKIFLLFELSRTSQLGLKTIKPILFRSPLITVHSSTLVFTSSYYVLHSSDHAATYLACMVSVLMYAYHACVCMYLYAPCMHGYSCMLLYLACMCDSTCLAYCTIPCIWDCYARFASYRYCYFVASTCILL